MRLIVLSVFACTFFLSASAQHAEKIDVNPTFTISKYQPGSPMRIVGYGDMRFTDPSVKMGTNPRVRKYLAERVAQENPEVLLLTGDMPYIGSSDADWQVFRDETALWRKNQILQLPTTGNHEVRGDHQKGIENYLQNFPGIQGHRYLLGLDGQRRS